MQTDQECMNCFLEQARSTAHLCTEDKELQELIVEQTEQLLQDIDMTLSPPENAVAVYKQIAKLSGVADPFAELKKESNIFALALREKVNKIIHSSEDPLYTAIRFAIAGNIIDYGARHEFDALQTLSRCTETPLKIDEYHHFQADIRLNRPINILYLADNCGEIVFDTLLVEQLLQLGHTVTCVVRGEEIINDVTHQDAKIAGMEELCKVISNGTSCPGTPLGSVSNELKKAFQLADIVISKGQGNFETLSDSLGPIYFLLTVKCPVVARHITVMSKDTTGHCLKGEGEMVFMKKEQSDVGAANQNTP